MAVMQKTANDNDNEKQQPHTHTGKYNRHSKLIVNDNVVSKIEWTNINAANFANNAANPDQSVYSYTTTHTNSLFHSSYLPLSPCLHRSTPRL